MLTITLDTNCIINLLDHTSETSTSVEDLSEIVRYGLEGDVNIAVTTRVEDDLNSDKDVERKKEIIKRISMFPVIGTILRLDYSKLDSSDFFVNEEQSKMEEEIKKIIFPGLENDDSHFKNKIIDVDHIVGHCSNKRDIFVTDDKTILKKAEVLKNSLNIVVMSPQKCLEYINLKANKSVLAKEFYENILSLRGLITEAVKQNIYDFKEPEEYAKLRKWLIQKYPVIKDSLLRFKLSMLSVPFVGSQMSCDQGDVLHLRGLNEEFQNLFREENCKAQIFLFADCYNETEYNRYRNLDKNKVDEKFKEIIDLLLGYIGYLENNF